MQSLQVILILCAVIKCIYSETLMDEKNEYHEQNEFNEHNELKETTLISDTIDNAKSKTPMNDQAQENKVINSSNKDTKINKEDEIIEETIKMEDTLDHVAGNHSNFNWTSVRPYESRVHNGRFLFSPLTIVQIPNENCTGINGQMGSCITWSSCLKSKGRDAGSCALGFGVCCIILAVPGGKTSGNNTLIFRSRQTDPGDFTYTIMKYGGQVCQFRLDVIELRLTEVTSSGVCDKDYMTVSADNKFGKVCSTTRLIHFFLDVEEDSVDFFIHIDAANTSFSRSWEICVQQVMCMNAAPKGCGQWYHGKEGFLSIWGNVEPDGDWYYIDDQEYAICVRWEARYCSIRYREVLEFLPKCNDLFERPGNVPEIEENCHLSPPNLVADYTYTSGLQYFYVRFKDFTNLHVNTVTNSFKNVAISYEQMACP